MMSGIKFLICGSAASGKTTIAADIKNALVINLDEKPYTMPKTIVASLKEYNGINDFMDWCNSKIVAYKEKFKKLPEYIVFDTITRFYTSLVHYNSKTFSGYQSHQRILEDTYIFNKYLNTLCNKGINIVCLAHTVTDRDSGRITIPAQGSFRDNDGWLSVFDEAIYLGVEKGKRIVAISDPLKEFPCRQVGCKSEVIMQQQEFDINKYIADIHNRVVNIDEL